MLLIRSDKYMYHQIYFNNYTKFMSIIIPNYLRNAILNYEYR